jgi:hypothetical protein
MRLYQLELDHSVDAFMVPAERGEREGLFVREGEDGLEMALVVPELSSSRAVDLMCGTSLDPICQIIEGVSHFVYVTACANAGRSTTQLELELQAEVDKYVVLATSLDALTQARSEALRQRLYESAEYTHHESTPEGARYRLANDAAHRYVRKLERDYVARCRFGEMRDDLRRFYRASQADKLR